MTRLVAEVSHLHVSREAATGRLALLDDVSFGVAPGEIVGVVGETGAGKTLATKALLGLVPRTLRAEGTARVVDVEMDLAEVGSVDRGGRSKALATKTAIVMQNPASMLDPLVRVSSQLIEAVVWHGLLARDAACDRARALLTELGFRDPDAVMRLYPHQLSGGMAQRAAIAMALMSRPSLLVVDEPTSALDANVRIEVLELLQRTARDSSTAVLLVSHDLPLISRFASRLVVFYAGRVVETGRTAQLLTRPQHPYTEALLRTAPSLRSPRRVPLPTICGAPPSPGQWPTGCGFRPRCRYAIDRCAVERPELEGAADGQAACFVPSSVRPVEESG